MSPSLSPSPTRERAFHAMVRASRLAISPVHPAGRAHPPHCARCHAYAYVHLVGELPRGRRRDSSNLGSFPLALPLATLLTRRTELAPATVSLFAAARSHGDGHERDERGREFDGGR